MSSFRSALDEARGVPIEQLSDAQLEEDFEELELMAAGLQAERHRRLAEIHRRRTWERDGHLSTVSWLVSRFRMAWSVAARRVRTAAALEEMPSTREALAAGAVSPCATQALVAARESHPVEFEGAEETLVEAARTLSVRGLRQAVAYWRQPLDGPRSLREAEWRWGERRLHVSNTLDGMVRMDGNLDPETGQTVLTALRAVEDADARDANEGEVRSSSQRRADALGEVCRQWLDLANRPNVAGQRPHVTVVMDVEALEGKLGVRSEFEDTGPIHPEIAKRWACDASIARVLTRGRSESLDVGRQTPVVSPAIRRAVVLRDRVCRFPGCERPHSWCDAHHVVHWADGGPTAVTNLALLCRRHHRLVHMPGGFPMEMGDRGPVFRRPDGSVLEDRAPP